VPHGTHTRSPAFHALIVLACLSSHLALAGAAFWHHHHDDGEAEHDRCAVCVAVAADKTDGLPPPLVVAAPLRLIGLLAEHAAPDTSIEVPRHCLARGPPLSMA
jgi:hypothetical protein